MIPLDALTTISDKINNKEYGDDFKEYTLNRIFLSELYKYLPLFDKVHWEAKIHPMSLAKIIIKNHPKSHLDDASTILDLLLFLERAKAKIVFRGHYVWLSIDCLATYTLIHNVYCGDILAILFRITQFPSFTKDPEASKICYALLQSKVFTSLHFLRECTKSFPCQYYRIIKTLKY